MVKTSSEETAGENLSVGTELPTVDGSRTKIVWIGQRKISLIDMLQTNRLLPVRIQANALGDGYPTRDLLVSQQHRILRRSIIAERMYGQTEVLVSAKNLAKFIPDVDIVTMPDQFTYWHFACEKHEGVSVNGALAESQYLGPQTNQIFSTEQLDELALIFPQLFDGTDIGVSEPARLLASGKKANSMLNRHVKNSVNVLALIDLRHWYRSEAFFQTVVDQ